MRSVKEYKIADQLLRSGTSIGAMVFESRHSESKKDFVHKLLIALKESDETEFWLRLLKSTKKISENNYHILFKDLDEIIRILSSIVKTTKSQLNNPN